MELNKELDFSTSLQRRNTQNLTSLSHTNSISSKPDITDTVNFTNIWKDALKSIILHNDRELDPFTVTIKVSSNLINLQFNKCMGLMLAKNITLPCIIPIEYRPTHSLQFPILVNSNKEKLLGLLYLTTSGTINIYPGLSIEEDAWGIDTICSLYGTSISWQKK